MRYGLLPCAILLATTACTSQQGYQSAQNWQRTECNKMLDQNERAACMSKASTPYDDYKRETENIQRR